MRAAADLGVELVLLSAPNAAANVGPGWFDAVVAAARASYPGVAATGVLDCGDAPGDALAALRHGIKAIRYDGSSRRKMEEIAQQYGARVFRDRPQSLDLPAVERGGGDLSAACHAWLAASPGCGKGS